MNAGDDFQIWMKHEFAGENKQNADSTLLHAQRNRSTTRNETVVFDNIRSNERTRKIQDYLNLSDPGYLTGAGIRHYRHSVIRYFDKLIITKI